MLKRVANRTKIDASVLFAPLVRFARIGLAVSGGPDSLALMLLMADWAPADGKKIFVYTLDHRLRPEAAAEAAMVAAEAEKRGFSCRVLSWNDKKPASGIQAAARRARYRLIGEAMQKDGVEVLVTAHHRGDQAETVLMRLAHGSGIGGLAGMTLFGTVEGVTVCRPLLDTDPALLREVVREAGLVPARDPSNHDDGYERVRWRGLMSALADEGLDAGRFGAFARRMARADAALTAIADDAFAAHAFVDAFGVVTLAADELFELPAEIGLRVFDRAVTWAGGGRERYRLAPLEAAYEALGAAAPGHAATLGGAAFVRSSGRVRVFREAGRLSADPASLSPGLRFCWDGRFAFSCGKGLEDGLTVTPAGSGLTRAAVEKLAGPIDVPMRAIAAAPVVRDGKNQLIAIGTLVDPGDKLAVSLSFNTNPRRTGQNTGNQDARD